ncbi:hypothetical protein [Methylobacterium sp. 37f]|uniref:hypothetical protein n=1 Tax=Methylobacterium sp. 37f TaxID=2817058 RepID=UPI001FFD2183|nr:hypothetical protein [Methylobacterium sp. 37f]MCK2054233.1 hypothetical protein [Methylobacterium sp. 37f]
MATGAEQDVGDEAHQLTRSLEETKNVGPPHDAPLAIDAAGNRGTEYRPEMLLNASVRLPVSCQDSITRKTHLNSLVMIIAIEGPIEVGACYGISSEGIAMILILLAAISGSVLTMAILLPQGIWTALICAPLMGSLFGGVAAFVLMARRGEDWATGTGFDQSSSDQTDAMVKSLREIATKGRVSGEMMQQANTAGGKDSKAA